MEVFNNLLQGFVLALSFNNLLACFLGVLIGTIVGVLPGIGPVGAMALLLPFSFGLDAGTSLILLAGIYYGAMYGGSTTSILINVPGEAASVVTCLDGYQMARKGRAGAALAVAGIGSWVAGTVGVVLLMLFAPPLGKAALSFGPPEYFAISLVGMLLLSNLSGDSFIKAFLVFTLGMMISTIGIDVLTGFNRLSFDVLELTRGIEFLPCAMGLFGMAEVFAIAVEPYDVGEMIKVKFRELYPNREELKKSVWPVIRGSFVGFPIGLIPGPAAILSSLVSYRLEKGISKHPEEFGKGAIEGVAGPESANNAAAAGAILAMCVAWIRFGKPDTSMALNCTLAGLVAVTAPCAVVSPLGAIAIGAIAGVLVVLSVEFIDKVLHVDDPVGAVSVHLVNGVFGTLAVGLFASPAYIASSGAVCKAGLFYGGGLGQLGVQALGAASVAGWVAATTGALFFALKAMKQLRVKREEELRGLDVGEHGMEGYNGFQIFVTE